MLIKLTQYSFISFWDALDRIYGYYDSMQGFKFNLMANSTCSFQFSLDFLIFFILKYAEELSLLGLCVVQVLRENFS